MILFIERSDQVFLALPGKGFNGAFPGQGLGTAAALFPVNKLDRPMGPGVAGGLAFLMHLEPAVDVGGHAGIKGPVAAPQDVEKPGRAVGCGEIRLFFLDLHPPEHPAIFFIHY